MWLNLPYIKFTGFAQRSGPISVLVFFLLCLEWLTMTEYANAALEYSPQIYSANSLLVPLWLCWVLGLLSIMDSQDPQSEFRSQSFADSSPEKFWNKVLRWLKSFQKLLKCISREAGLSDKKDNEHRISKRRRADMRNARAVRMLVLINLIAMFGFGFAYVRIWHELDYYQALAELHSSQFLDAKNAFDSQFQAQSRSIENLNDVQSMMISRLEDVSDTVISAYKSANQGERYTAANGWEQAQLTLFGKVDMSKFPSTYIKNPKGTWFHDWLHNHELVINDDSYENSK